MHALQFEFRQCLRHSLGSRICLLFTAQETKRNDSDQTQTKHFYICFRGIRFYWVTGGGLLLILFIHNLLLFNIGFVPFLVHQYL